MLGVLNERNLVRIREHVENNISLFDIVDIFNEPDDKFSALCTVLRDLIDEIEPIKKFRLKKHPNLPWFDKELLHLTIKRDISHRIAVDSKTKHDSNEWMIFREARNKFKLLMRVKMTEYFR